MLAYQSPVSWVFPLSVDNVAAGGPAPALTVDVWGITNWPATPDHHVRVGLNGTSLGDAFFEGQEAAKLSYALPAGLLADGANSLSLTLPGDTGVKYDVQELDQYSVAYPRAFVARAGRLTFAAAGEVFKVTGLPQAEVVVYRLEAGVPRRLTRVEVAAEGTSYSVRIPGTAAQETYVVSTVAGLGKPSLVAPRPVADIASGRADYLIITHPSFEDGLAPLVQAREAQGMVVKVVDVEDVYQQFGFGIFDAAAIRGYVKHAVTSMGVRYVLLVGGDTYDYQDYLKRGSVSFIPSLYAKTDSQINWAPVDPLYADVDDDGVQDVPLGRFPVRTGAELAMVIGKTLVYKAKTYGGTAVLAADVLDPKVNFTADAEAFAGGLSSEWSVTKAYIDHLGVSGARKALIDAMNRGVALTGFVGHSSPTAWTFQGLFKGSDATTLTNAGKPTVVAQWGCWNTFYVDPTYSTLGHTLMLSGDRGAAAVLGASTLTQAASERLLGSLVLPRMVTPGATMGDAIVSAKRALAQVDPNATDVLLGWTLLGDPALVVEP